MLDLSIIPDHFPFLLYGISILYALLTLSSISKYRRHRTHIRELVERSIPCNAEIVNPVVLNGSYTTEQVKNAAYLFRGFQNFHGIPFEYACTEVKFTVNGQSIQTIILRLNKLKQPKVGDIISINYDPLHPQQAFAENMKSIVLRKPLRDCIIYGLVVVVCLLSAVLLQLA